MLGTIDGDDKMVRVAMPLRMRSKARRPRATNCGPRICWQPTRRRASAGMDLIGIFHSHPDCDAYFSETDLENSCPWYSFVVLSIQKGEFDHANSWLPNSEQTEAEKEELITDMAKVLIPTPLRQFTGKQDTVSVAGATVGEVLSALTTQFPDLRKQIFNDEGKLRSFVNVYLNDEDIRYLSKDATPVKDGDTISIVPSHRGRLDAWPRRPTVTLSKDEILRYSRHLIMPEVGMEGQLKLKNAKVLLVGTGGLGAPLGLYLAAAGVGRIGLVDFDVVDFTNLQRQVIHGTKDVGRKKLDSAADTMHDINPYVQIDKHEVALTSENALDILKDYDIVVDGTDNFPTRYLVNDACVLLSKPNVYGSIFRFEGQATVFAYRGRPLLSLPVSRAATSRPGSELRRRRRAGHSAGHDRPDPGDRNREADPGHRRAAGRPAAALRRAGMRFRELKLRKNPECPVCGDHPTITKLIDYQQFCGIPQQQPRRRRPK